ncbi:MAG: DNA alkylation repair protein [Rhizobiaceae bacterium]|nr:DNA alkylation repair protein [Rhizobiaceae bacterium]
MPEPFKNAFNPEMIAQMGDHLGNASAAFDVDAFVAQACDGLENLELKQRSNQIRNALVQTLPSDHRRACKVMIDALHPVDNGQLGDMSMDQIGIRGWPIMPMAEVVTERGLKDFDFSLDVLAEMTTRFSAEFAIRPFFNNDWRAALDKALIWALSDNFHVRRLASEGSRPRLPWGLQIPQFVADPAPLLPLLESLKNDPEEYVRRSVANNINDIAKDHPDFVADLAARWMRDADKNTTRMVRHACRTLIKKGHAPTLSALGYSKPKICIDGFNIKTPKVKLGNSLEFAVDLTSMSNADQPLVVDFAIHYQRANGQLSPKVYKWKALDLKAGQSLSMAKKQSIRQITTRVFYAGTHGLEIQINGEKVAEGSFELVL